MAEVEKILIGDFLKRIRRPIEIENSKEYKLLTVKLHHKGVVLRCIKNGTDIRAKKMYTVKAGDFILSGIDARNGAFGIVPEEMDGAIVTNDFWYFEVDSNVIDKRLFLELTKTSWFDDICRKGSDGTTQRIRLQKDKFFNQEIRLPTKKSHDALLNKILNTKNYGKDLSDEITRQLSLLKKLRQSILQDAISGKLTKKWREENPDVEPASELLARIKAEKERWINDEKIKNNNEANVLNRKLKKLYKNYPPLPEPKLPSNWIWVPLIEALNLVIDCHNKTAPYTETGIMLVRTSNIRDGKLDLKGVKFVTKDTYDYWSRRCPPEPGDVLYTREAPVGEAAIIPEGIKLCMGQRMMLLRPFHDMINKKYLLFCLNNPDFIRSLEHVQKGAMVKHLRVGDVENAMLALPPINEQKAIVSKVEKLFAYCDSLEKQIGKSQQDSQVLMQAVLKEAFAG